MARKVQLKNKNGQKVYPVTSSEQVKMTSGGGNLDEKLSALDANKNSTVYTDVLEINRVIKLLFIDKSKYTGSYSLDGLKVGLLCKNLSPNDDGGTYGFRLFNGKGDIIASFWKRFSEAPLFIEMTYEGLYCYAEYNWSGMDDGSQIHEQGVVQSIAFDAISDVKRRKEKEQDQYTQMVDKKIKDSSDVLNLRIDSVESLINGEEKDDNINQLVGVGTSSPSEPFESKPEGANNPKCESVRDDFSPFKDILGGYCIKITNTKTEPATSYLTGKTEDYIKGKPNNIKFAFFTRKKEWNEILEGFLMGFALYSFSPTVVAETVLFDVKKVIGGDLESKSVTGRLFDYDYIVIKTYDDDVFCKILLDINVREWKVTDEYKGLRPYIIFNQQQPKWINKSIYLINPQLLLDSASYNSGIYVCPDRENVVNFYYPVSIKTEIDNINNRIDGLEPPRKSNKLTYDGRPDASSYIESPFNEKFDIKIRFTTKRSYNTDNNPCFNFMIVNLVNKQTLEETQVHVCADDITPANYNGTYLGANHGCSDLRKVTANSHGKTFADIGSEWSDGEHKFYIVGIVDENNLLLLGENYKPYPAWKFYTVDKGKTLTHVSGGTNTDNIVVSESNTKQFYPSLSVKSLKLIADGEEITENGVYYFNKLDVCEIYDVFNVASTLDKIKEKVGTFKENPKYNELGADKVVRHSINYRFFSADKCFVATDFIAYQDIDLNYFGFIQQGPLWGSIKMYIPKTLPIMDGDESKDFRTIVDYNAVNNQMRITSEYWENQLLPPDRYIQSSQHIAFNSGYLFDYGVGGTKRKDCINNAFYLYTSRKIYPYGIDDKIDVSGGTSYSAVGFRIYTDIEKFNKNGIINSNVFEYEGGLYLYLDFNAEGLFEVPIPSQYIGKKVEILEISDNVELLSKISNTTIMLKVGNNTPMYGYAVLKVVE